MKLHVIQKESLARAMRTGELKKFLHSPPCTENGITLSDLAEQSGVDAGIWKDWMESRVEIEVEVVHTVVGSIREYESTVMVQQLERTETNRERAIRHLIEESRRLFWG